MFKQFCPQDRDHTHLQLVACLQFVPNVAAPECWVQISTRKDHGGDKQLLKLLRYARRFSIKGTDLLIFRIKSSVRFFLWPVIYFMIFANLKIFR